MPWSSRSRPPAWRRPSSRPARAAAAARSCSAPGSPRCPTASSFSATSSRPRGATGCRCAARTATGSSRRTTRSVLWGDALTPREPGAVALISQSGNVAVNALATRRGLRFHTVVASGNQAVLGAADYLGFLARRGRRRGDRDVPRGRRRPRAVRRPGGVRRARGSGRGVEGRQLGGGSARGRGPQRRARRRSADLPGADRGGRGACGRPTSTSCSSSPRRSRCASAACRIVPAAGSRS